MAAFPVAMNGGHWLRLTCAGQYFLHYKREGKEEMTEREGGGEEGGGRERECEVGRGIERKSGR